VSLFAVHKAQDTFLTDSQARRTQRDRFHVFVKPPHIQRCHRTLIIPRSLKEEKFGLRQDSKAGPADSIVEYLEE
jgi:hypothetical protein